ncbi:MAG: electron transfer flavoprotein subunit beta/FixA family protein [Syntrophomonadaceae bacterium]|nr:electron transfer flavoprotein subunit beta/FixA family protein [Syntrophomonadaceae bacterium]
MKIAVLAKQTFDTEAKITLKDGKVSEDGINLILNPYDEVAVEEALQIKEKQGGEVIVVTAGPEKTQDTLRQALAMGADKGVVVSADADADEYARAGILAKAVGGLGADLILCGHVAADDGSSQVPTRMAEILNLPHVNVVRKLELNGGVATCTRETDGGTEIIEVKLPAVITCQVGMNEPRYPSMKGIMQAKKKPVDKVAGEALANKTTVESLFIPPPKAAGKKIEGEAADVAAQLVNWLKNEARVVG